jgi:hypothetical protein
MDKPRYIYALSDPDTGAIRYIGATVHPLKRLSVHLSPQGNKGALLKDWIDGLRGRIYAPSADDH